MASIFQIVKSEITAKQAAQHYGLQFDRYGNRAFCPWHDDGKHPALAFYPDGCYCHSCGCGGDAVGLVAQMFGLTQYEAAQQIASDFNVGDRK